MAIILSYLKRGPLTPPADAVVGWSTRARLCMAFNPLPGAGDGAELKPLVCDRHPANQIDRLIDIAVAGDRIARVRRISARVKVPRK